MMNVARRWRFVGIVLLGIILIAGYPPESAAQQQEQEDEGQRLETRVFEIVKKSSGL